MGVGPSGGCRSKRGRENAAARAGEQKSSGRDERLAVTLHPGLLPSLYQQRVVQLADEAVESPPADSIEETLRKCIAFCYGVTPEWAPHVRVTVFADNPSEHQNNVPVYDTLLIAWGTKGSDKLEVRCMPVQGTDVTFGRVVKNEFWARSLLSSSGKQVLGRALIHQLLSWFADLQDADERKQLLVNILLQLHEACFNCVGRHKEVFEYCVYDLLEAEALGRAASGGGGGGCSGGGAGRDEDASAQPRPSSPSPPPSLGLGEEAASRIVRRFAAHFLDRHKRSALHMAVISPLKFLYQDRYEVFENLDSHGASFWVATLTEAFFPGLGMPFESIVDIDKGWTWAAIDFLPLLQHGGPAHRQALERLSAPDNLGRDWRQLTAGLRPAGPPPRRSTSSVLSMSAMSLSFRQLLQEARRSNSPLHKALVPYAQRFAEFMAIPVVLRRFALATSCSERWDVEIGPALAALTSKALGEPLSPAALRERLLPDAAAGGDGAGSADVEVARMLLGAAGVEWCAEAPERRQ